MSEKRQGLLQWYVRRGALKKPLESPNISVVDPTPWRPDDVCQ